MQTVEDLGFWKSIWEIGKMVKEVILPETEEERKKREEWEKRWSEFEEKNQGGKNDTFEDTGEDDSGRG